MIKVLVFEPGQAGKLTEIEDHLEALQAVVGGYIQHVGLGLGLCAICNEDGKAKALPKNRFGFVGTFFFVRNKGEDYVSLTSEDVLRIAEWTRVDAQLVI